MKLETYLRIKTATCKLAAGAIPSATTAYAYGSKKPNPSLPLPKKGPTSSCTTSEPCQRSRGGYETQIGAYDDELMQRALHGMSQRTLYDDHYLTDPNMVHGIETYRSPSETPIHSPTIESDIGKYPDMDRAMELGRRHSPISEQDIEKYMSSRRSVPGY